MRASCPTSRRLPGRRRGVRQQPRNYSQRRHLDGRPLRQPAGHHVNGVTGYQWKPFDSLSDDDRDMDYQLLQIGAGYQLTDNLYGSLTYEHYDVDLQDGNTAFQAYQLHNMASGQHDKNKLILLAPLHPRRRRVRLQLRVQLGHLRARLRRRLRDPARRRRRSPTTSACRSARPGFRGRFGGWNSLIDRGLQAAAPEGVHEGPVLGTGPSFVGVGLAPPPGRRQASAPTFQHPVFLETLCDSAVLSPCRPPHSPCSPSPPSPREDDLHPDRSAGGRPRRRQLLYPLTTTSTGATSTCSRSRPRPDGDGTRVRGRPSPSPCALPQRGGRSTTWAPS